MPPCFQVPRMDELKFDIDELELGIGSWVAQFDMPDRPPTAALEPSKSRTGPTSENGPERVSGADPGAFTGHPGGQHNPQCSPCQATALLSLKRFNKCFLKVSAALRFPCRIVRG